MSNNDNDETRNFDNDKSSSSSSVIKQNPWIPSSIKATSSSNITNDTIRKPYTSIKKLDLNPKRPLDQLNLLFNSNNAPLKRFKVNNNDSSDYLIKNFPNPSTRSTHVEPLTLKRSSSRLSTNIPSSISGNRPGSLDFIERKYIDARSSTGRASPASFLNNLKIFSDTSSVSSRTTASKHSSSYFYPGKTTFGGANLRKNIHRLSGTPYSRANVRYIEPQPSPINRSTKTSSAQQFEDLPLSSVTQRILERLEKAATPVQDAKSRLSTTLNQSREKLYGITSQSQSRLFDTSTPSADNKGRCTIDFSHKPMKYILKLDNDDDKDNTNNNKSIDSDLQKLKQIKEAEKALINDNVKTIDINQRKTDVSGKMTLRDVKKGRKVGTLSDEIPSDHFKSLANVKPLSSISALKPLQLNTSFPSDVTKSKQSDKQDICDKSVEDDSLFKFSSPELVASLSTNLNNTTTSAPSSPSKIRFSTPINVSKDLDRQSSESSRSSSTISLVDQSKQKKLDWTFGQKSDETKNDITAIKFGSATNLKTTTSVPSLSQLFKKDTCKNWICPTCSVSNDIDEKVCVSCEEPNPNKKSEIKTVPQPLTTKVTTPPTDSSKIPLNQLFKATKSQAKGWTCSVCFVTNDSNDVKCVSCEEPNPNNKAKATEKSDDKLPTFGFKFGAFSSTPVATKTTSTTNSSTNEIKTQETKNEQVWQCFYCKAQNQPASKNICNECQKIKVVAATKDQLHKFYETQTFKFGSMDVQKTISKSQISDQSSELPPKAEAVPEQKIENTSTETKNEIVTSAQQSSQSISNPETKTEKTVTFGFGTNSSPKKFNTDIIFTPFSTTSFEQPSSVSSASSLFTFGSKSSLSAPISSSTTTKSDDKIKETTSNESMNSTIPQAQSTAFTSAQQSTSNIVFGSKPFGTDTSNKIFNVNPTTTTASKSSSLFNFSSTGSTNQQQVTPKSVTFTSLTSSNAVTAPFTFGTTSKITTSATSTTETKSDQQQQQQQQQQPLSVSFDSKNFNFGSPLTVPKIDVGSTPAPEINLNFPVSTSTTSNSAPLFSFGANKQSTNNTQSNTNNSNSLFKFNNPNNVTLNTENPIFGSNTIPTSFNFMGTTNNLNTNNSIFQFGAKTNETNQQQQQSAGQAPQQQPTFTMNNVAMPFGSGQLPGLGQSNQISVMQPNFQANNMFQSTTTNLQVGSEPIQNLFEGQEGSGAFMFDASQGQRKIKRAKRRLGRPN